MTTMTYQVASGAGAAKMLELVKQMECLTNPSRLSPSENALEVDRMTIEAQRALNLPTRKIGRLWPAAFFRGSIAICPAAKPVKNGKAWLNKQDHESVPARAC